MEETSEPVAMAAPEAQAASAAADSKKQILKSTGILGFSQVLIILIGVARVKVLAVLLGAAGVGVAGLYQNTIDLARATTGLGLRGSAVRDIAASAATGEEKKVSIVIKILRRWVWFTGVAGMLLTLVLCRPLSHWAFGTTDHSWGIAILSVTVLLTAISDGQNALLQGMRQIGTMARANIAAALSSLVGASVIYWCLGGSGIVPVLVLVALTSLVWNWHYSRRIKTVPVEVSTKEIFSKGLSMARLGFYLSITSIASTGMMYIVRALIARYEGLNSVGYFTASWSISYMYLSAIFGAMAGDYFPRLSAVQHSHEQMGRLVNEQIEVALLIVSPVIIGMITFISLVVRAFYSKDFGPTTYIMDWQLTGDFFKAIAWAMGFVLLAKGKGHIYLFTELSWHVVYLSCIYLLWPFMGLSATGVSFLIAYCVYAILLFSICRKLISFRFSKTSLGYMAVFLPMLLVAFCAHKLLVEPYNLVAGGSVTMIAVLFSYKKLRHIIPVTKVLGLIGIKKSR